MLDMHNWQGRTPECEALMRQAVIWSMGHGLSGHILLLARGATNILLKLYHDSRSEILAGTDTTICQNYDEVVAELQKRGFKVSRECLMP